MKNDITTAEDVSVMVRDFYSRVQKDPLIGPIFIGVIKDQWPAHFEKLEGFWETILFNRQAYSGSPFRPHADLPVEARHFEAWMTLFRQTVDDHFEGEKAEEAKLRASKMAEMFQYKIQFLRQQKNENSQ